MPEKFVVKPLNELVPEDVSKVYDRVDVWLKQTTGNLIGLDEVSVILKTLPITGNLFAVVDVVDDIRDLYYNYHKAEILDWATLGIDLIGIIPLKPLINIRQIQLGLFLEIYTLNSGQVVIIADPLELETILELIKKLNQFNFNSAIKYLKLKYKLRSNYLFYQENY